jgi:type II secretory pathway pseudopilin PulG
VLKTSGVTLIELIAVAAIISVVIVSVQAFFMTGLRSSVKGQDSLDSSRTLGKILNQIRTDIASARYIETSLPPLEIDAGSAFSDWNNLPFSPDITMVSTEGKVKYRFENSQSGNATSNGKIIREITDHDDIVLESQQIGNGRIQSMNAARIDLEQRAESACANKFRQVFLVVQIGISSDDQRFPAKVIDQTSIFSTFAGRSIWNRYFEPGILP